jgi:hypothetical protein
MNTKLFEEVLREAKEAEHRRLFEKDLSREHFRETVVVESGKIYVLKTEEDKLKTIEELWNFYYEYSIKQIKINKQWKSVIVENTDPPLRVEVYPKSIEEIFSHTPKQEAFIPKVLCLQALPRIIQKLNHITINLEEKGMTENEHWYKGICDIVIDNIPYVVTVKLVKKINTKDPRFYIYFLDDLNIKK